MQMYYRCLLTIILLLTISFNSFAILWECSPTNGGTITTCSGCSVANWTITATPKAGYRFLKFAVVSTSNKSKVWATSTNNPYHPSSTYLLSSGNPYPYTIIAYFEALPSYTITTSATNGTVTGGGTYVKNATATLTATPNDCYQFTQWSDGNTDNPRTITVTGNATYTAEFEKLKYTIRTETDNVSQGSATVEQ